MAFPVRGQALEELVAGIDVARGLAFGALVRQRAALKGLAPARLVSGHAGGGDALAVGRVQQHHAGVVRRRQALQRIAAAQLHSLRHAGALGVALGKVNHAVRDVAAEHAHGRGFQTILVFSARRMGADSF